MKPAFLTLPLISVAATLAACSSAPPGPGTAEYETLRHDGEVSQTKVAASEAPDWFVNPPKDNGFVYAAGSASSSDLQFALDKAILNAKYQLADQVNGKLSGKQKDFVSENGGGRSVASAERATSNVIADVALPGYQVVNRKVVPVDSQFRSYVLLKFAVASIDTRGNQAAADDQAVLQKQAKAAFDDLQAELVTVRDPPRKVVAFPIGMEAPAIEAPPGVLLHSAAPRAAAGEPPLPAAAPRPAVVQDSL